MKVSYPTIADVACPKCDEKFRYLVTLSKETFEEREPNSCPKCKLVFDLDFYKSLQSKFLTLRFINKKAFQDFEVEFKKKNNEKFFYFEDIQMIENYCKKQLLEILPETLNSIRFGYVNPNLAPNSKVLVF